MPVVRELRVAASLIFLGHRDLSAPWCSEVSLFDASPWGGAVVAASILAAEVKETSRRQEFDAGSRSAVIEHISDQLNDPDRPHCHPYLTYHARSGEQS